MHEGRTSERKERTYQLHQPNVLSGIPTPSVFQPCRSVERRRCSGGSLEREGCRECREKEERIESDKLKERGTVRAFVELRATHWTEQFQELKLICSKKSQRGFKGRITLAGRNQNLVLGRSLH
ncbi:hypothetical protein LR48_Vigan325s000100 [Vigna angularis]|uniref:Uncharacterized protein n=1 Tax=Phaseolus angularis TaxID=3914 RepID=A0A0L9T9Q8_PHAAN|nr:hypothetical protein LR48_Vigan325s000100 [Vigna angularis]